MKTTSGLIAGAVAMTVAVSAGAWGWNPYAPYPLYGYGSPALGFAVAPLQITDEQRQALAEQQVKAYQEAMEAQRKAAEQFAEQYRPFYEMEREMREQGDALRAEMVKDMQQAFRESFSRTPFALDKASLERRQAFHDRVHENGRERYASFHSPYDFRRAAREEHTARMKERTQRVQERRKALQDAHDAHRPQDDASPRT
jgi:hypothetical protein